MISCPPGRRRREHLQHERTRPARRGSSAVFVAGRCRRTGCRPGGGGGPCQLRGKYAGRVAARCDQQRLPGRGRQGGVPGREGGRAGRAARAGGAGRLHQRGAVRPGRCGGHLRRGQRSRLPSPVDPAAGKEPLGSVGGTHGGADLESVAAGHSPVHRLDPRVKIVGLIGLVVVAVTTPTGAWLVFASVLAALFVLAAAARLPPLHVVRRMNVEIPFLLAAAILPFTAEDGVRLAITVGAKITIGVLAMIILSSTTPFPRLLQGFAALRAPALLLGIVSFMWRYLHVLADEVARMKTAREARGYSASWIWQAASGGPLIATLFLRALGRGERVYLAMLSRGYAGSIPEGLEVPLTLRRSDVFFLAGLAAMLVVARVVLP
ncbi:MAG: cobalt ECF transporter T component CbiQ [Streptosporangiales bacterium]|nr:cobalt ECF transporter T component CbiQ [Streptosporangiales bacterium]